MDCIAGMSSLPANSIDLILSDLPYGITDCYWDSLLPLDQLWAQFNRVLKPNGAAVLTACQPFTTALINSNPRHFKYCWYWRKNMPTGFCFARYQPMRCMEDIAVFYRKMPVYHPQGLVKLEHPIMDRGRPNQTDSVYKAQDFTKAHLIRFTGYPRNLLEFSCERGLHPTQKPVALFAYLIRTYTDPGGVVLDACMGSGTTAAACIRTGRSFIGYEIDPKYYALSLERIQKEEFSCQ